jgi:hypothetical protein
MNAMSARLAFVTSAALAALALAAPARATLYATEPRTFPVTTHHRIRIEFPVGELKVVSSDESRVRFELRVRCNHSDERCEELANRLVLDSDDQDGTLHLKLRRYPEWRMHGLKLMGELHVPRSLPVKVEMGVGELQIVGLEGDLDVDLGVGEAAIRTPRSRANRVTVETGIGDAQISGAGGDVEHRGFLGSHASWSGNGRSDLRIHVGVGEGRVRLE